MNERLKRLAPMAALSGLLVLGAIKECNNQRGGRNAAELREKTAEAIRRLEVACDSINSTELNPEECRRALKTLMEPSITP